MSLVENPASGAVLLNPLEALVMTFQGCDFGDLDRRAGRLLGGEGRCARDRSQIMVFFGLGPSLREAVRFSGVQPRLH